MGVSLSEVLRPIVTRCSMAREQFIDSLRLADGLLDPPAVKTDGSNGWRNDHRLSAALDSADLWLSRKAVEGFDPGDFEDWPQDVRQSLSREVTSFLEIAGEVPADKPATKSQSKQARKHLESVIGIVRDRLLSDWLAAQNNMLHEAIAAAEDKGWHVDKDEKEVRERLLGAYWAPRVRIRTPDREAVLDPIACFAAGRQGVVDLVVLPTYETMYYIAFKDGDWRIASSHGASSGRAFTREAFLRAISKLPRL